MGFCAWGGTPKCGVNMMSCNIAPLQTMGGRGANFPRRLCSILSLGYSQSVTLT